MRDEGKSAPEDDAPLGLPVLDGLSLDAFLNTDDSPLANAVRRLLREMSQPVENYTTHSSMVDERTARRPLRG